MSRLEAKRQRAKARREADPEGHRSQKRHRYYNEPGYKERVVAKIRQRRLADPSKYLWSKAKRRAEKKGLEFTIRPEDVPVPDSCPILGIPIGALNGASIDRIDNSKGYVRGNVIVISRRANTIKGDATFAELKALARFYSRYQK